MLASVNLLMSIDNDLSTISIAGDRKAALAQPQSYSKKIADLIGKDTIDTAQLCELFSNVRRLVEYPTLSMDNNDIYATGSASR